MGVPATVKQTLAPGSLELFTGDSTLLPGLSLSVKVVGFLDLVPGGSVTLKAM